MGGGGGIRILISKEGPKNGRTYRKIAIKYKWSKNTN